MDGSPSSPPIAIMLRIYLDWFTSTRLALIPHIHVHITFSSMTSQPPRQPESRRGDLQEGQAASFSSEWANGGYVNGARDYGITTCLTVITDVGKRELRAQLMLSYSSDDRSSSAGAAFDTDDGGNDVFVLWWSSFRAGSSHTHWRKDTMYTRSVNCQFVDIPSLWLC